MPISLDALRSPDANKSCFISDSTDETKEVGAWRKFNCLVGFGDDRGKAALDPEGDARG